jgi:hypothetical protein
LTLLFILAELSDQELQEALRRLTDEISTFRWMYAAIWIPMFGALIGLSIMSYLQYKRALDESKHEEERSVLLNNDIYDSLVERGGDMAAYVNLVVGKALKEKQR